MGWMKVRKHEALASDTLDSPSQDTLQCPHASIGWQCRDLPRILDLFSNQTLDSLWVTLHWITSQTVLAGLRPIRTLCLLFHFKSNRGWVSCKNVCCSSVNITKWYEQSVFHFCWILPEHILEPLCFSLPAFWYLFPRIQQLSGYKNNNIK